MSKSFPPHTTNGLKHTASKVNHTALAEGFLEIIKARQQYLSTREIEKTRRFEIQKLSEVELASIREQSAILQEYLQMTFIERRQNFDYCFSLLDKGLENDNQKQIEAALSIIVTTIKESPLKQAAEIMSKIKNRSSNEIIDI